MQTGRKILNLRCDRRVSQQELARVSGITPSALSKIEAGINSPRANVLWRIARNLGVTVEYLLDEQMPYPYAAYNYRYDFLTSNEDPGAVVRMEVTKEERAFLEALRKTSSVARDLAMAVPAASMETLRLMHFLVNHSKVVNPSRAFLQTFESLVSGGETPPEPTPAAGPASKASRPAKKGGRRRTGKNARQRARR